LALVGVREKQVFFETPVEKRAGRAYVAHREGGEAIDHRQRLEGGRNEAVLRIAVHENANNVADVRAHRAVFLG
jgi:hypothetical protein